MTPLLPTPPEGPGPSAPPQPSLFHVKIPDNMDIDPLSRGGSRIYRLFTFDDIPQSQWRTRIYEFHCWLQL